MEEWIVQVEDVAKVYTNGAAVRALDGVSLALARGELAAVVGPSGSGKTTLLSLMGALDLPTEGRVKIDGVDTHSLHGEDLADLRREKIGFVFQLFYLMPALTALENVMIPLVPYRARLSFDLEARARELLEWVGLGSRLNHLPGQLSAGEQQRVAIARALINSPQLILADEPTGSLDSRTGAGIIELLRRLNRERQATLMLATHDPSKAAEVDRVFHLVDGRLTDHSPVRS